MAYPPEDRPQGNPAGPQGPPNQPPPAAPHQPYQTGPHAQPYQQPGPPPWIQDQAGRQMVPSGPMQPMQPQALPGGSPKYPAMSLMLSFFLPGLGTLVNGEVLKGLAIACVYWFLFWIGLILLFLPWLLAAGVWIFGMYDAYSGAHRINRIRGYS